MTLNHHEVSSQAILSLIHLELSIRFLDWFVSWILNVKHPSIKANYSRFWPKLPSKRKASQVEDQSYSTRKQVAFNFLSKNPVNYKWELSITMTPHAIFIHKFAGTRRSDAITSHFLHGKQENVTKRWRNVPWCFLYQNVFPF